jgi:chromosomal replication initiator protein
MILVSDIQREAAVEFQVPLETMTGRRRHFARSRQAAIYVASCLTRHSYTRIGQLFGGRDHSTVLSAIRVTRHRLRNDEAMSAAVRHIARRVL